MIMYNAAYGRKSVASISAVVAAVLLVALTQTAGVEGLSWPACENGGSVWVTEQPKMGSTFPGANFWFFCEGSFNLAGAGVSACVPSKKNSTTEYCGLAVADAACQLLGYDETYPPDYVVVPALPTEHVLSLDGEYCVRKGNYSKTLPTPEELKALPGEPCEKISSITCVRTVDTIAKVLASLDLPDDQLHSELAEQLMNETQNR